MESSQSTRPSTDASEGLPSSDASTTPPPSIRNRRSPYTAATMSSHRVRRNVVLDYWMHRHGGRGINGWLHVLLYGSIELGYGRWIQRVLLRGMGWERKVIDRMLSFLLWQP